MQKQKGHEQKKERKKSQLGLKRQKLLLELHVITLQMLVGVPTRTLKLAHSCLVVVQSFSLLSSKGSDPSVGPAYTYFVDFCPILKYALIRASWILLECMLKKAKM